MKKLPSLAVAMLFSFVAGSAFADDYNKVPDGDAQYAQCIKDATKRWEGGDEKSKVAGQSNKEAFCTCLWNETPDNFRGNLASFSESDAGKKVNKICEKHSGWGD